MNGEVEQVLQNIAGHLRIALEQLQAARSQIALAESKLLALMQNEKKPT